MGTVANALNMLYILSSGRTYKIRELAEKLEVSSKSIRVYREALDGAGIYVLDKRGKYGGYYLPKDFQNTLLGLDLNEEEKMALELVESEMRSSRHVEAKHISSLLTKLQRMEEKKHHLESPPLEQSAHIVGGARPNIDAEKEREKLVRIIRAKRELRKVSLLYRPLSGTESRRTLQVYNTYTYRGEIYMVAYCELRQEIRDFKLRRAHHIELLDELFERDEHFSMSDYMKNCIGVFKGEEINLKLKIREPLAQVVRETVYTDNQSIVEIPEEQAILYTATMRGRQEIVAWILSMGSKVRVIEPAELRVEIAEESKNVWASYQEPSA